jgi:hypothetical protein
MRTSLTTLDPATTDVGYQTLGRRITMICDHIDQRFYLSGGVQDYCFCIHISQAAVDVGF